MRSDGSRRTAPCILCFRAWTHLLVACWNQMLFEQGINLFGANYTLSSLPRLQAIPTTQRLRPARPVSKWEGEPTQSCDHATDTEWDPGCNQAPVSRSRAACATFQPTFRSATLNPQSTDMWSSGASGYPLTFSPPSVSLAAFLQCSRPSGISPGQPRTPKHLLDHHIMPLKGAKLRRFQVVFSSFV